MFFGISRLLGRTPSGAGEFYIDDGSLLNDGSGKTGLRVSAPGLTLPQKGSFVIVTGVSSCYQAAAHLHRMLRPRCQEDISVVE